MSPVTAFMEYLRIEKNYSPYTVQFYKEDIEDFTGFMKEESLQDYEEVAYFDARLYITRLYERNYARASAARKISCLRSFYKFLLREKIVKENPFALVIQPKKGVKLPSFLYEEEMEELFSVCHLDHSPLGRRNTALIELMYATGIRVSECAGILMEDIDLELGTVLVKGKGKKERYVPFGVFAQEAVAVYIKNTRNEIAAGGHRHLFVNARGGPLTARGIRHILSTIMEKAAVTRKVHPHMFRHSFATHLLNNGADMRSVQELLGHEHLSSTQVYTHVTKEYLRETYLNSHPRA